MILHAASHLIQFGSSSYDSGSSIVTDSFRNAYVTAQTDSGIDDIPMLGLTTSSSSSSLMLALNSGPGNLGLQAMSMGMALLQIRLGMST